MRQVGRVWVCPVVGAVGWLMFLVLLSCSLFGGWSGAPTTEGSLVTAPAADELSLGDRDLLASENKPMTTSEVERYLAAAARGRELPSGPLPASWRWWREDAAGLRLLLPQGWEQDSMSRSSTAHELNGEGQSSEVRVTLSFDSPDDKIFGSLVVTSWRDDRPLEQVVNLLDEPKSIVSRYGISEVAGFPAWRLGDLAVVGTAREDGESWLNFSEHVALRHRDRTYWLHYSGSAHDEAGLAEARSRWRLTLASIGLYVPGDYY